MFSFTPRPLSPLHRDSDTYYVGPTIRFEASNDDEISVLAANKIQVFRSSCLILITILNVICLRLLKGEYYLKYFANNFILLSADFSNPKNAFQVLC